MLPNPLSPSTTLSTFLSSLNHHLTSPSLRIPLAFFLLGLLNNLLYVIILSAALDLVGPTVAKSVVLLFDVAPSLLLKLVLPYFLHRLPYPSRTWLCVLLASAGMLIVALSPSVIVPVSTGRLGQIAQAIKGTEKTGTSGKAMAVKLFGIALASLSSGLGESSFLALTSVYGRAALGGWSSGTGAAGLVGAGAYVLATTTLGLSSRTSLLVFSFLPVLMLLAYFVVLPRVEGRGGGEYKRVATEEGDERRSTGDAEGEQDEEGQGATGNVFEARKAGSATSHGFAANLRRARSLVVP